VFVGLSEMVKIDDALPIPCRHRSRVVWISEDGSTIAVKCLEKHKKKIMTKYGYVKTVYTQPIYLVKVK